MNCHKHPIKLSTRILVLKSLEPVVEEILAEGRANDYLKTKLDKATELVANIPDDEQEGEQMATEWRNKLAKWWRGFMYAELAAADAKTSLHQVQDTKVYLPSRLLRIRKLKGHSPVFSEMTKLDKAKQLVANIPDDGDSTVGESENKLASRKANYSKHFPNGLGKEYCSGQDNSHEILQNPKVKFNLVKTFIVTADYPKWSSSDGAKKPIYSAPIATASTGNLMAQSSSEQSQSEKKVVAKSSAEQSKVPSSEGYYQIKPFKVGLSTLANVAATFVCVPALENGQNIGGLKKLISAFTKVFHLVPPDLKDPTLQSQTFKLAFAKLSVPLRESYQTQYEDKSLYSLFDFLRLEFQDYLENLRYANPEEYLVNRAHGSYQTGCYYCGQGMHQGNCPELEYHLCLRCFSLGHIRLQCPNGPLFITSKQNY